MRKQVIDLAHAGHQGLVKTKILIRARVWFPKNDHLVEDTIKECSMCQSNTNSASYEPLKPSPLPNGPWENVDGDFFRPMRDSVYWFDNLDEFSRNVFVSRIKSTGQFHVISVLENLFSIFGVPRVYKTDNPPFQSHGFADFAARSGFEHKRTNSSLTSDYQMSDPNLKWLKHIILSKTNIKEMPKLDKKDPNAIIKRKLLKQLPNLQIKKDLIYLVDEDKF